MAPQTRQRILWVALPGTVGADGRPRIAVMISPHLRPAVSATLAAFPDFLDWAERMHPAGVSFSIEVEGGPIIPAAIVSQPPVAALWRGAFNGDIPVQPYRFDDYS